MKLYKKILILLIIIIFSFILFKLLKKRYEILNKRENFLGLNSSAESELSNAKDTSNSAGIQSLSKSYFDLPLSQYVIKASYNSALTGSYISLDMLKYVLSRGCRFLDFEIYNINNAPYVAYSTDPTYSILETENKILLDNVLSSAVTNGFNSPSPNTSDPLFIHLRIKSNSNDIYNSVAKSIYNSVGSRLYTNFIDENTKYSDIMGKVVIVMDKTINYNYKIFTKCGTNDKSCYDLTRFINIESGSEFLKLTKYSDVLNKKINPPNINNNNITTDVQTMQIVLPNMDNNNIKNPLFDTFVAKYGCQLVTYRFYNKDEELENYERFFKDNKFAFLPMTLALQYFKKKDAN